MNEEKSFEEKLEKLETIVKNLEAADVPLNDAIKLFENGTKLAGDLEKELNNAELKIKNATEKTGE
jgi:exodeoxyribonuclease VII small subunit